MRWKRSTPNSAESGFTLVELLVAAAITVVLLGVVFSLVISARRTYRLDQTRTAANQNLRAAMDLIGADVRQAGERLPSDVPAVMVERGRTEPNREQFSVLTLRKNTSDAVLPVCEDVRRDDAEILVVKQSADYAACAIVDGNGNGYDDRLETWRDLRCQQDGVQGCQNKEQEILRVFLYDPVTREGQWLTYDNENLARGIIEVRSGPTTAFLASHHPRLYAMEEHRYWVNEGKLVLTANDDKTLKLIEGIIQFDVEVTTQDGTRLNDFNGDWTGIASVSVTLGVKESLPRGRTLTRRLTASYVPRNVLSH